IGAVTGIMSLNRVGHLEDACTNKVCSPSQQDTIDAAGTLGTVSTVGFVVGGAGIGTGIVLLLLEERAGSGNSRSDAVVRRVPAKRSVSPWVGARGAGLSGTF